VLPLGRQELAVLRVLAEADGRVVARTEIARRTGLSTLNARRVDSVMVSLRRTLGTSAVQTVRQRGWRLEAPVRWLPALIAALFVLVGSGSGVAV
jgi:DNA-binding winged helix-turn-helix (wHTH) protein